MKKVFVYGTLKSTHQNSHLMSGNGGKKLGVHTIPPAAYALVNLSWFPAVIRFSKYGVTTPVIGEVWEIPDDTLDRLDSYEGYPHLYDREEIETKYGTAWMYVYNDKRDRINVNDLCRTGIWPEESTNAANT